MTDFDDRESSVVNVSFFNPIVITFNSTEIILASCS